MAKENTTQTRAQRFVISIISNLGKDRGMGAKLRRADNPATEYQAWEYLVRYGGVDLENTSERKAFCTVGAALAKIKPKADGKQGIGKAIAICDPEGVKGNQANAKLQRLLACGTTIEVCDILRSILPLIADKAPGAICYARLLDDLRFFNEQTRVRWAQDFFRYGQADKTADQTEE